MFDTIRRRLTAAASAFLLLLGGSAALGAAAPHVAADSAAKATVQVPTSTGTQPALLGRLHLWAE